MTLIPLLASLAAYAADPAPPSSPGPTAAPATAAAPASAPTSAPPAKAPPGPPEAIVSAVSTVYGKPVPPAAICTVTPTLPAEFTGSPMAVGVMRGAAGCRLMGVIVNGAWTATADAAVTSLGANWASLKQARKEELLEAWTQGVLLAFDQLDPAVKVVADPGSAGAIEVDATFWQRTETTHVAKHTTGTFFFDKNGKLETSDRERGEDWRTAFYVQDRKVAGVSVDGVMKALEQQGRTLANCMDESWKQDLTSAGRVQIQWTIRDKVATQVAFVEEEGADPELAKCYGNALRRITFPDGMAGTVVWSFNVVRGKVTPEGGSPAP